MPLAVDDSEHTNVAAAGATVDVMAISSRILIILEEDEECGEVVAGEEDVAGKKMR